MKTEIQFPNVETKIQKVV